MVNKKDRVMKPTEWAKEDRIDPVLFLWWNNQLMTRREYELIKQQVWRKR